LIRRLSYRLFRWFCDPDFFDDIAGDLEELYRDRLEVKSYLAAEWLYLLDVIFLFRPSLIRKIGQNSIFNSMISNYFKIGVRHLSKHKSYTLINVLGLALGISGFLMIHLYTSFERSYDSFHDHPDELYRVSTVQMVEGVVVNKDAMASYPLGKYLQENLPEIKSYTLSKKLGEIVFRFGDNIHKEDQVISADSTFLDHFTYQSIQGNPSEFFKEPLTAVLTRTAAQRYFGDADPVGQVLEVLSPYQATLKIVGVIEDVPYNTHYRFDIMVSDLTFVQEEDFNVWNYNNHYLYTRLHPHADIQSVQAKMYELADEKFGEDNDEYWDIHSVQDIHLTSDFTYEPQIHGNEQSVIIMTIIGWILVIIAWVNYINLATAKSVERAREVGMRKVVGAHRGQIIMQFISEALLINLLSILISVILLEMALPQYEALVGTKIIDHVYEDLDLIFGLCSISVFGAILSGLYPAFVMSNFQPVFILKGKYSTSRSGVVLRKVLVTMQIAASFILITSTFIVSDQVSFMQHADKGINVDHVITFELPDSNAESEEEYDHDMQSRRSFIAALQGQSTVLGVGGTSNVPGGSASDINSTTATMSIPGLKDKIEGTTYVQWANDAFFDVMKSELLLGRKYDVNMPSDSNAILVNEAFIAKVGVALNEEILGKRLKFWGDEHQIVGVVQNFNRTTLKNQVEPTLYMPWRNPGILVVRMNPEEYQNGLKDVEKVWSEFYSDLPFLYTFLDERFERLYIRDFIFGKVFLIFSIVSILVSMLGLFGLSSFSVLQRTKEMGMRKVLGASVLQVATVFFKDFAMLLCIGVIMGTPLVYWSMENWLSDYAFRIDFPWVWLAVSALLVLLSAGLSIGYQILQVTRVNPATTLKYE
jgi:putative ABC transport system permease protein